MESPADIIDKYKNLSGSVYNYGELYTGHEALYTGVPDVFIRKNIGNTLFDYQLDLSKTCIDFFLNSQIKKALMSLPTGAGKTRIVAYSCLNLKTTMKDAKIAWLAPTKELLVQAKSTFYKLWVDNPNFPDITISNSFKSWNGEDVLFTTPQEIAANKGAEKIFDFIVFDEAHQSIAKTFNQSIERIGNHRSKILGISATPGRVAEGESNSLVDYFENNLIITKIIGDNPVKFLQNRHVLSKPKFISLGPEQADENERIGIVTLKLLANNSMEKSLIFAKSVDQGKKLTLLLREYGLRALFIEGEMSTEERGSILDQFEKGKINILINQKLLSTGYDCPNIDSIYILGKISSPIQFEQIIGRASRGALVGGSSSCKIYDFDNHLKIHGEPNSYKRYIDLGWIEKH